MYKNGLTYGKCTTIVLLTHIIMLLAILLRGKYDTPQDILPLAVAVIGLYFTYSIVLIPVPPNNLYAGFCIAAAYQHQCHVSILFWRCWICGKALCYLYCSTGSLSSRFPFDTKSCLDSI